MKKLIRNVRVNVDEEIAAMVAYIESRYDNLGDPVALFKRIYSAVVSDGPLWFAQHPVREAIVARVDKRSKFLIAAGLAEDAVRRYDAPTQLMLNMPSVLNRVHDDCWELVSSGDYTQRTRAAYAAVVKDFPQLLEVLPRGWAEARAHYEEHADMSKYAVHGQRKDEVAFEGFDSSGHQVGGFTMRSALTSIMYDHVEQGRKAPFAFMGAVYAHLAVIHEHNNTVDLLGAFEQLDLGDTEPVLMYDLPASLETGHPSLDTVVERALTMCQSAADLREMKASFDAAETRRASLSPEQLAVEEAEGRARMKELIGNLFSKQPNPEAEKRLQDEDAACLNSLRVRVQAAGFEIRAVK